MPDLIRVGITGTGILSSISKNVTEFYEALRMGKCGVDFWENEDNHQTIISVGAKIPQFSFDELIKSRTLEDESILINARRIVRRSPYTIQNSALVAAEAWGQAQLDKKKISPERVAIIVAGSNLTLNTQYSMNFKYQQAPEYVPASYALQFMDTDQVGTISEVLGIQGEGFTIGGASASGNLAIIKGYQLIKMGLADACVVIGAMADLSPLEIQGFANLGAIGAKKFRETPKKACCPFDIEHEGFIYGQASACLILESMESITNRGAVMLGEMLGGSILLDANRLSDPSLNGEAAAMTKAIQSARISPSEVDYVNTHGTSTPLGDETELKALRKVFKQDIAKIWLNSTKGLVGHCLYSAGVVEAIACILQLKEGFIHPNINLYNPIDDGLRFAGAVAVPSKINIAMSNSFGFGGINSSIILKRGVELNESWN